MQLTTTQTSSVAQVSTSLVTTLLSCMTCGWTQGRWTPWFHRRTTTYSSKCYRYHLLTYIIYTGPPGLNVIIKCLGHMYVVNYHGHVYVYNYDVSTLFIYTAYRSVPNICSIWLGVYLSHWWVRTIDYSLVQDLVVNPGPIAARWTYWLKGTTSFKWTK